MICCALFSSRVDPSTAPAIVYELIVLQVILKPYPQPTSKWYVDYLLEACTMSYLCSGERTSWTGALYRWIAKADFGCHPVICCAFSPPRKSRHRRKRPSLSVLKLLRESSYLALLTSMLHSMTLLSISPICLAVKPSLVSLVRLMSISLNDRKLNLCSLDSRWYEGQG